MGKQTRYGALPDQSYDPRVTDMRKPFNVPASTGPQAGYTDPSSYTPGLIDTTTGIGAAKKWRNQNVSNTTPFQLIAGAPAIRALAFNERRTGIILQNKDATATINWNFNIAADINSMGLGPGASVLLDFTTVPGELYLFAPGVANVQVCVMEIIRAGS